MTDVDLVIYKLYRSNSIWFAARTDGYSITVRDGLTFKFEKGEMKRWANYWLGRARESWEKLQDVQDAAALCTGANDGNVTSARIADSPAEVESGCICPECTERMM